MVDIIFTNMDKEVLLAAEGIYDGSLAQSLLKGSKYALTGFAVGAFFGVVLAMFTGKSRLLFAIAGGTIGGGVGYIVTPEEVEVKK